MQNNRTEPRSPGTGSPRRLGRMGTAVVGLALTIGGSVLLVPTISSAHTGNAAATRAVPLKTQEENLAAIASKMHLGAGALLAAQRSLAEVALDRGVTVTSTAAETRTLVAIAHNHRFGLGELLGAERALQNAGMVSG